MSGLDSRVMRAFHENAFLWRLETIPSRHLDPHRRSKELSVFEGNQWLKHYFQGPSRISNHTQ